MHGRDTARIADAVAVKHALLALLDDGPRYGYQLKAEFDRATGERWPLNIGQVYSTLQRLARDELVCTDGPADDDGRQRYVLTGDGRTALAEWFDHAEPAAGSTRDELTMKVLIAAATNGDHALTIVSDARTDAMSKLQALTARKIQAAGEPLAVQLQHDRAVFVAEADIRWLDLVEQRLEAAGFRRPSAPQPGRLDPKESS